MVYFNKFMRFFAITILLSGSVWLVAPSASAFAFAGPVTLQAESETSLPPAAEEGSESQTETNSAEQPRRGLSFLNLLFRGGWFMIPLGLLSLLVVTLGFERILTLRREKLFPTRLVDQLSRISQLEGGLDPRVAYQVCQKFPSSASYILRSVLTRVGRPQAELESCLQESSQREATRLNQTGSWLTLAAAVAPLIGLLGTVWGITQAFYDTTQLVEGQNRAEALAQGIYTALVTTMVGLLIAIPAAVLAHFFENRIIGTMNQISEMVSNLLPQFERYEGQLRFTQDESVPHTTTTTPSNDSLRPSSQSGGSDQLPTVRPR